MAEFYRLEEGEEHPNVCRRRNLLRCIGAAGVCVLLGAACCSLWPTARGDWHEAKQSTRLGADRDAHGCIPSAGYTWCEALLKCVRPWETSCLASTATSFAATTRNGKADLVCGACDKDATSLPCRACLAGLTTRQFCKTCSQQGLNDVGCRSCEATLSASPSVKKTLLLGNDRDDHGCLQSAGYRWCEQRASCIRPWMHGMKSEKAFDAFCKKTLKCNCPPAEVVYPCTEVEHATIMNGTDCPFYQQHQEKTSLLGDDRDEHGCIPSAGYRWCDANSSCIRPWMHNMKSEKAFVASCKKKFTCNCPPAEVLYPCTEVEHAAIMNGTDCRFYQHHLARTLLMGSDRDEHGCLPSAGYIWCDAKSSCIRPWTHGIKSEEAFVHSCQKTLTCNCPPAEVVYACTEAEHAAIADGTSCPFYKQHPGSALASTGQNGNKSDFHARMRECNCPPSEVLYPCTETEYVAIMNGTSCPYYKRYRPHGSDAKTSLRR